jgi:hypothetical protein
MPRITIDVPFKKRLAKKSPELQAAVLRCVKRLGEDPRHPGLNVHKMQGLDGVWEAYVDQGNRVTFEWSGDEIVLRNHCNHDMLRRNP